MEHSRKSRSRQRSKSCSGRERSKSCSKRERSKSRERYYDDCLIGGKIKWQLLRGDRGPRGDRGKRGKDGKEGPMGPRGYKGERGDRGRRGYDGPQGPMGPPGCPGERGPRGKRGKAGSCGPRGKKGEKGDPGKNTILGFSHAINSMNEEIVIAQGAFIPFNIEYFPQPSISVSGSDITLLNPGIYKIDYYVKANSGINPVTIAILVNGSMILPGSTFSSVVNNNIAEVRGSTIVKFPDPDHGIFTGAGTILNLQNLTAAQIILPAVSNNSVNAYIDILRIE